MANTTSAKKATRKIARRTIINKSRRTQMRGAVRIVEEAIKSGDRDAALARASDRKASEMNRSTKIFVREARHGRASSFSSAYGTAGLGLAGLGLAGLGLAGLGFPKL